MARQKARTARFGMEKAVEVMEQSVQEPRDDGVVSPSVGAVLIRSDGSYETAYRGELRQGDHAEYTLIERKLRSEALSDGTLFATLEPCAPGARSASKLSCAERIVNARIPRVWVGVEDPDPKVDRKGIQYLLDHGVEVEMFDKDLQERIRSCNEAFITQAEERAKRPGGNDGRESAKGLSCLVESARIQDLSPGALESFAQEARVGCQPGTPEFLSVAAQLGIVGMEGDVATPTANGILLFGKRPQYAFPHALIRAVHRSGEFGEDIKTIEGNLIEQVYESLAWFRSCIGKRIDRSSAKRVDVYDYPDTVIRECLVNAVVHRDYEIDGAPILFEVGDDAVVIKSPGLPVAPIKLRQLQAFSAPTLARNPTIMYVFDQIGLCEQRGLGFRSVRELPARYGLPLPLVEYDAPYVVFTFPRSMGSTDKLSDENAGFSLIAKLSAAERRGLDFLRVRGGASRKEYEAEFSLSQRTASRHLADMVDLKLAEKVGQGPSTRYIPRI